MFKYGIKDALKSNWKETAKWGLWIFFGGLFPVWGGILILIACSKFPTISDFSKNGQFTIYSAAMFASALYIVFKDYKTKFPGRNIFGFILFLGLVLSTILFSLVTADEAEKAITIIELNRTFIQYFSISIYIISLIIAFLLVSIDNRKMSIDLMRPLTELNADFDRTGENQ